MGWGGRGFSTRTRRSSPLVLEGGSSAGEGKGGALASRSRARRVGAGRRRKKVQAGAGLCKDGGGIQPISGRVVFRAGQ